MVRQWSLPNHFASKTQKFSLRYYFIIFAALCPFHYLSQARKDRKLFYISDSQNRTRFS